MQLFAVPFSVISTLAVADPSYVTTSRRVSVTASSFAYWSDAEMLRIVVPAVGYGRSVVFVGTGITRPVVVSPTVRVAVKLPRDEVPVVDSVPADAPLTERWVLPCARPVTVRELELLIVVVAVSTVDVSPSSLPPGPRPRPQ